MNRKYVGGCLFAKTAKVSQRIIPPNKTKSKALLFCFFKHQMVKNI